MKFKQTSNTKSRAWVAALAGVLSLTVVAVTQAAFVPVPVTSTELGSPVLLTAGTLAAGNALGTVQSFSSKAWSTGPGGAFGSLRSMVVNNGGNADFYYQIVNSSPFGVGDDVWRVVANGFASGTVQATYLTSSPLATLNTTAIPLGVLAAWAPGVGNTTGGTVFEADQSPLQGAGGTSVGFDFDSNQLFKGLGANPTAPSNVEGGQVSDWLVVRTTAPVPAILGTYTVEIDTGAGSALTVPIPEPTTVAFGLALTGVCLNSLRRNRKNA